MSDGARIVCSRCGSNNFSTQASCWKCGAPLAANAPSPSAPAPLSAPIPRPAADSATPFVAAAALGLLFPLVAVPVGIVFLMLDDSRKSAIGRWNIAWGIAGTILHTVATGLLVQALLMPTLLKGMTTLQQQSQQSDLDKAGQMLKQP